MNNFRSNIFKRKKRKSKSKYNPRTLPTKYFFRCDVCGSTRRFSGFLDAYNQGYYLPCPVYCPNRLCGCSMTEIPIIIYSQNYIPRDSS